jgi:hypothetical protein
MYAYYNTVSWPVTYCHLSTLKLQGGAFAPTRVRGAARLIFPSRSAVERHTFSCTNYTIRIISVLPTASTVPECCYYCIHQSNQKSYATKRQRVPMTFWPRKRTHWLCQCNTHTFQQMIASSHCPIEYQKAFTTRHSRRTTDYRVLQEGVSRRARWEVQPPGWCLK